MSAPELKIIEVSDGAELTLRLWRTSSAVDIPLLLLHGLSQQGQFWAPVVNRMRSGTVAALDQRGHGRSDVPLNLEFTIPRCALDVAEICAAMEWNQVVLVGHSWGAWVAINAAAEFPELIKALALIDGGLWGPADLAESIGREETVARLRPPQLAMTSNELWQMLESGPAAGALAGALFGKRSKIDDVLAFDMGGTTAKAGVVLNPHTSEDALRCVLEDADVFLMMNLAFYSDAALEVNRLIFETIYHAAIETSANIAHERYCNLQSIHSDARVDAHIGAYETFMGSPASKGVLQFDLWGVQPTPGRYDWDGLKERVKSHGMRNSLLVALMPTASTSQILGNNECFEPITSNIYTRRTLAGEFIVVNRYLMTDLIRIGAWNERTKQSIIKNKGSVQQLDVPGFDEHLKNKFRTVWEIPMKHLIDMSVDRGAYICQSQSLNLWVEDPNYNVLTSMHFYAWKKGLKTGIYYLRRKAKHQAQQFTVAVAAEGTGSGFNTAGPNETEIQECELCSS